MHGGEQCRLGGEHLSQLRCHTGCLTGRALPDPRIACCIGPLVEVMMLQRLGCACLRADVSFLLAA